MGSGVILEGRLGDFDQLHRAVNANIMSHYSLLDQPMRNSAIAAANVEYPCSIGDAARNLIEISTSLGSSLGE